MHPLRVHRILAAAAAALACAALLACPAPANADDVYPKLGIYGRVHGNGDPFYNAPLDSTLDTVVLDEYARYDQLVLDVNPLEPYRPDILAELRSRHPGIRILAYVTGNHIWNPADVDSTHHYPTRYRRLVRDLGGFLYNSVDGTEFPHCNVNLALRDSTGRYVMAEGLADLFIDAVVKNGLWDGLFIDEYCEDPTWMEDATHQFDYVRAGYASHAEFLVAWQAGTDTLANRLRRLAGATPMIVGNCGESAHHAVFNGWMREGFPFQRGGTWNDNMLRDPQGYLADDRDFVPTTSNYLSTSLVGVDGDQYNAANTRSARYGLGSATLGEGYAVFNPASVDIVDGRYYQWWYDEYAVDIASGQSMTDLSHTHWLGHAKGPAYQMIWAGTNPDCVGNPGFETDVTSGWTFGLFAPAAATIERDTTTAGAGSASAHITVASIGTQDWHVNLTTRSTLPLVAGRSYAATFWAKASAPRRLPVVATLPAGGQAASQAVTIGTEWRHYQVVLQPQVSATVELEFFLGLQAGQVWFDDVHFQEGETSLWRRDFDNGVVFVNPSSTSKSVPLGGSYRRILGIRDRAVNDGATVTTGVVAPNDALFLIGTSSDTVRPGKIGDAAVKP